MREFLNTKFVGSHTKCFCLWRTLENSFNKTGSIDKDLQNKILEDKNHNKSVLYAIVDVIMHLAKQGSFLRESNENLDFSNPNCGKFLNTVELVSHYHALLRIILTSIRMVKFINLLSNIQNEFLEIIYLLYYSYTYYSSLIFFD